MERERRPGAVVQELPYQLPTCLEPRRKIMRVEFPAPFWELDVHEDCYHNQLRAIDGRVLGVIPQMDQTYVAFLMPIIETLSSRLRMMPSVALEDAVSQFPAKRRKRYLAALETYLSTGLTKKDAIISSFVKMEKTCIEEKNGDPRMIQTRGNVFHLIFSQMSKPLEHSLMTVTDPITGLPMIAKGSNLDERARMLSILWRMRTSPVAISLDLSRWDMHVQVPLMEAVLKLYSNHTQDPLIHWCMHNLLNNMCFTNQRIKYKVVGGVMSGDMTTALGNCIAVIAIVLTFRALVYSVVSEGDERLVSTVRTHPSTTLAGIEMLEALMTVRRRKLAEDWLTVYDDGDDHVVIVDEENADIPKLLLPLWWRALGHSLKVEGVVDHLCQLEFCQHKPFIGERRQTMVPNPYKVIPKSCLVTGKYLDDPKPYLRTVYTARAMLHKDIPVLGPFFQNQALKLGSGHMLEAASAEFQHVNSSLHYLLNYAADKLCLPDKQEIAEEDRYLFWKMWGMTPTEQIQWEQAIVNNDWERVMVNYDTKLPLPI